MRGWTLSFARSNHEKNSTHCIVQLDVLEDSFQLIYSWSLHLIRFPIKMHFGTIINRWKVERSGYLIRSIKSHTNSSKLHWSCIEMIKLSFENMQCPWRNFDCPLTFTNLTPVIKMSWTYFWPIYIWYRYCVLCIDVPVHEIIFHIVQHLKLYIA